MTTILHVEEDLLLAGMVEECFKAFGFRGAYLAAPTIQDAKKILDDVVNQPILDLVLSDMELADGNGLDVVRSVRSNPVREHVPVVILSGDTNPQNVKRAYAVGANSYIPKGTRGRPISQVMRTLYAHWLKDARLPQAHGHGRTHLSVRRAIHICRRKAEMFMRIAEHLGGADGEFWMDFALREGNLANLLVFLSGQLGDRELPNELLDRLDDTQLEETRALDGLERYPVRTRHDAERYIRVLAANIHPVMFARVTAELFPVVPVAMTAMREVEANNIDEIATWIETNAADASLRDEAVQLRADAMQLRLPGDAAELP